MEFRQSMKQRWIISLGIVFVLAVALALLGRFTIQVLSNLEGPDPDKAMQDLLQAALEGDERYVVELGTYRHRVELPTVSIERSAWDVLVSHANELSKATVDITTTGNDADLVSSEVRIVGESCVIECLSDNGQVVGPRYFYVYTCQTTN